MTLTNDQKLEIWKQSIATQMHFAELSIKMRQIGLTLAGATIALAIVLYRSNISITFQIPYFDILVPVGTVLCFSAAFILFAARIIDVDVYHRMLRGAVRFNELYEQDLDISIGWRTGLTESISAYSRYEKPKLLERRNEEGKIWKDEGKQNLAADRIIWFYRLSISALVIAGLALAWVENSGAVISNG